MYEPAVVCIGLVLSPRRDTVWTAAGFTPARISI
jgi:hypothetical protein